MPRCTPCRSQAATAASDWSSTWVVSGPMRPLRSAIGMNSSGEIQPSSAWSHRTRASTLTTSPVSVRACGWTCTRTSPRLQGRPQLGDQGQPAGIGRSPGRPRRPAVRRPEALASYIARSARLSSAAGSVPCAGASAMPSEPPISTSRPSRTIGCSRQRRARRATRTTRSSSAVPVEEDGELVAAQPGDEAVGADRRRQPGADLDQQQVALLVAEGVVDVLEAVEVEDHDRGAGGRGRRPPRRARWPAGAAAAPGWAGRSARRAAPRAGAGRPARRSAARRWRGWPPSPSAARRPGRSCARRRAGRPRSSAPRTPAPPRSGTATASRAAVRVQPAAHRRGPGWSAGSSRAVAVLDDLGQQPLVRRGSAGPPRGSAGRWRRAGRGDLATVRRRGRRPRRARRAAAPWPRRARCRRISSTSGELLTAWVKRYSRSRFRWRSESAA